MYGRLVVIEACSRPQETRYLRWHPGHYIDHCAVWQNKIEIGLSVLQVLRAGIGLAVYIVSY